MNRKGFSLLACALTLLTACGGQQEARVYTVPKEAVPAPPSMPPMAGGNGGSMANASLPEQFLNSSAIPPAWDVPPGWQAAEASSMRLASFAVTEGDDTLDIAVTSFPGDVGGLLANVNRWRGQLDLAPIGQAELGETISTLPTRSGDATVVRMSNGTTDTRAAILMHDGASWFIKMTGPSALVQREAEHFRSFVESTDFAATHNH